MPKLKTNQSRKITVPVPPGPIVNHCISSYEEYVQQRTTETDITKEKIEDLTRSYKSNIADPIHTINPNIEMGEYFVIPVSELREMIDQSGDNPEFIHICCALRSLTNSIGEVKKFPVVVLVPVAKSQTQDGSESYEICRKDNSVYCEAYPCPPDPRCPTSKALRADFFDLNTKFNNFDALR
jgi:hypothetical protein